MTELEMSYHGDEANALAEQLDAAQSELRTLCETQGLLPTYQELYEYFFGEEAFPNYSLKDWIHDAKFRHKYLNETWVNYRISLVMALIVSGRAELHRGNLTSAKEMQENAETLRYDLQAPLPSVYLDYRIEKQSPVRRGGYVKDVNRKCKTILNGLKTNHDLDGKDFKSFAEAVEYGVGMMLVDEKIEDVEKIVELKQFSHDVFRNWLRSNPNDATRFERYTGIAWNE